MGAARKPHLQWTALSVAYKIHRMLVLQKTDAFDVWLTNLRDERGRAKIAARIDRLALGHAGDVSPVGGGISEMRVHVGPGYRVYFTRRGEAIVLLLCGGDKDTQRRDIALARSLATTLGDHG